MATRSEACFFELRRRQGKGMRLSGIPIIQPVPLANDPCGPMGSPQPILQLKELTVDQVRYQEWKASLKRDRRPKAKTGLR